VRSSLRSPPQSPRARELRTEGGPYEPSASGSSCAISQIWPSGSVKLAVRIHHSRFIGPLSRPTPGEDYELYARTIASIACRHAPNPLSYGGSVAA
jgi:hypothetical protein